VIFGPTFAEMRDPGLLDPALRDKAREARPRPLDPLNLWNLSWKADGAVPFTVLPEALTGVRAPIVVLSGRHFPTGSHKVGPAYSILVEKQLDGVCAPGEHTLPLVLRLVDECVTVEEPEIAEAVHHLDRESATAVICAGGYRSSAATSILEARGFNQLLNVTGGTNAWIKAGHAIETPVG